MSLINLKVTGIEEAKLELRNVAERVSENARRALIRSVKRVVSEGKKNAPVDKGNLEESIHADQAFEGPRGRSVYTVSAGGEVNGVNVDEYAALVHENYEDLVAPHGPGKNTLAKMASMPGRYIGSKYLERAVDAEEARFAAGVDEGAAAAIEGRVVSEGNAEGDDE